MGRAGRAVAAAAVACCLAGCATAGRPSSALVGVRAPGAAAPDPSTSAAGGAAGAGTAAAPTTAGQDADGAATPGVTLGGATQITAPTSVARASTTAVTVAVAAPTPAGFTRTADPDGIVSVAVPSSWTVIPIDDKTLEALANQDAAFPAETRQQLQSAVAQAGQYMKVLAVGPSPAGGEAPTLEVIITPGAPSLTLLRSIYPQQVQAIGATLVGLEDATVDGRPGLRVTLKMPVAGRDLRSTQVVVPADGRTLIVSMASVDEPLLGQLIGTIVIPRA